MIIGQFYKQFYRFQRFYFQSLSVSNYTLAQPVTYEAGVKMALRESIYKRYANPGFKIYLERFSVEPKVLIEAGAHYGEDTVEIINFTKVKFALAFEPDPHA